MNQANIVTKSTKGGHSVKKSVFVVAMAVALVFLFAASAYASFLAPTRARTWNWMADYYTWGSPDGGGLPGVSTATGYDGGLLSTVGANPSNPGVHANYLANTAKCGVCHSVHRARGDGIMLLNTNNATCAGCHIIGSTVTNLVVNWGTGPHGGGNPLTCQARACHVDNPHGAGGSQWAIVAAKLLNAATDALLVTPTANAVASGISATELDVLAGAVWPESTRSLVRTGYNCNICHSSTTLAVLNRGWSELRHANIAATASPLVPKQGHIGVADTSVGVELWRSGSVTTTHTETIQTAFAPVSDCESCHDQRDSRASSGFTFPHGQLVSAPSTSNMPVGTRAFLWMGYSGGAGQTLTPITLADERAYDGNCLKCHRSTVGDAGVGLTY